jgi:hypothetical protein
MENYIGEDELSTNTDQRGVISRSLAQKIRSMRAQEQWERYDSVVIGEGANAIDRGWFDDWATFAAAPQLEWFSGRSSRVGRSFCNVTTERTDWAQDLHQTLIEFIAPPGIGDIEEQQNDALITPMLFVQQLANQMAFEMVLSESDQIALAPASHFPAGIGAANVVLSATAAPSMAPGQQGDAHVSNSWKWPEPVMLAAKAKVTLRSVVDNPMKGLLTGITGPGAKLVPTGVEGQTRRYPNWYVIRVTHRGPRYLQIRGARSSA